MREFELVLPCYNESKSLKAIISRAAEAARSKGMTPDRFQLIVVQNGSKDDSNEVLRALSMDAQLGPWFRSVEVKVNQGYGYGIWTGLQATDSKFVGWSHADQQTDPADAFKALEFLRMANESNRCMVKGKRLGRSLKERFVSRVFELFARFYLGYPFYEINAQPKVFSRDLLTLLPQPPKDFSFDLYVLYRALKSGYQIKSIDVLFPPRVHGFSNWAHGLRNRSQTIKNMIRYMRDLAKSEGRLS